MATRQGFAWTEGNLQKPPSPENRFRILPGGIFFGILYVLGVFLSCFRQDQIRFNAHLGIRHELVQVSPLERDLTVYGVCDATPALCYEGPAYDCATGDKVGSVEHCIINATQGGECTPATGYAITWVRIGSASCLLRGSFAFTSHIETWPYTLENADWTHMFRGADPSIPNNLILSEATGHYQAREGKATRTGVLDLRESPTQLSVWQVIDVNFESPVPLDN